ncbi:MAG: TIM44-like domain-containing protein [Devosia sp.]
MFASRGFRLSALLATLVMAFSLVAVDTAEARRGGSFGSRGTRTFQTVPATPTSPSITAPVQRSMTNPTTASRVGTTAATQAVRPTLFGGFGGMLLGGLLFSGLFGMMFGFGFGGFGGLIALLVQVAVLLFILNMFFGRRRQPAMAGGFPPPRQESNRTEFAGSSTATGPRARASSRAGRRDELGLTDRDLGTFEQRLAGLQDAFAREDYDALRKITTPEMMGYLAEELGQNAGKGLRNEVYDVRLVNGDIAESWRESDRELATVALLYESRDITRERATGKIVAGEDGLTQTTEVWTFVRKSGGPWLVSAIQETTR